MKHRPKLIEVAMPLMAINEAAAAEGSIGARPHPKNLHRWWARRPLSAARAVLWASLVDDPSGRSDLTLEEQVVERQRLFGILERLLTWDVDHDEDVVVAASEEVRKCFPDGVPLVVDPFGGGGAIPLEAQRLGLSVVTGDLNPVAVLVQRAMMEIPGRFLNRPPVHPSLRSEMGYWTATDGLAADIEAYGKWMQDLALERIGHHYPSATAPDGERVTPIAWIWARTVRSPDPAWDSHVPLVSSWLLSNKSGKPAVWIEPVIDKDSRTITYKVRQGGKPSSMRTIKQGNAVCLATGATIPGPYIKEEGRAGRLGQVMLAVVAEGAGGRVFAEVSPDDEDSARVDQLPWIPEGSNPEKLTGGTVYTYGIDRWAKMFTNRQLLALTTFSDLLEDLFVRCRRDAEEAGIPLDDTPLREGGSGAQAYAEAIVTYMAFVIDKCSDFWSSICGWNSQNEQVRNVFARQAIPMAWDFAEVNPFSGRLGSWAAQLNNLTRAVRSTLGLGLFGDVEVRQRDARAQLQSLDSVIVSTDPPYYDNISYADLSDFFFVWLRKNLSEIWPDECATIATPKNDELIANQHRAGSREEAEAYFESGMAEFMAEVARVQHRAAPATVYYAYKATESLDGAIYSTGWSSFLQGVVDAGLTVRATWPLRTERRGRMISVGANALASSIVLVCRPREDSAQLATRAEFVAALRAELPEAVRLLQSGNIAPVDIPQSTIGPGIGVFSRYVRVVESDGSRMPVAVALTLISDVLGEILDGEESEMDADSRFALTWYAHFGYNPSSSGDADGMARAKNTSLAGVVEAGIGEARAGKFRLLERLELAKGWSPLEDKRPTVWEAAQHLIAALERSESEAAELLRKLGGYGERARVLAYLLFKKATDKGWAEEAGAYNGLIIAWPALKSAAVPTSQQVMEL